MFGNRILLNSVAALLLAAGPAAAEQRCSFEYDDTGTMPPPVIRVSPTGKHVPVYRDPEIVASRPVTPSPGPAAPSVVVDDTDRGPRARPVQQQPEEIESPFGDEHKSKAPASSIVQGNCPQCESGSACSECASCSYCGNDCYDCGCIPFWAHSDSIFAEFLVLRPRGTNVAHATQLNNNFEPGGRIGVADSELSGGFRIGFTKALDVASSVVFTYTNFHSHGGSDLVNQQNAPGVISLVTMPGTAAFNGTADAVTAGNDIDFQTFDVDWRKLLSYGQNHDINFTLGFRYANLQQYFEQTGNFLPGDVNHTTSGIHFEGTGMKLGLDGERRIRSSRLTVYGKSFLSLLFGEFHSDYTQFNVTSSTVEAATNWNDQRCLPILELEVGVRWTSANGRWQSSTGYYNAFWFNAVSTPQFISAAQTQNFVHLGETITFDGFVSRLEYRF